MEILVTRDVKTATVTLGRLSIDGHATGYTLELPVKDGLPGSAIPCGRFKVTLWDSPHFGQLMPYINVPGRTDIEIHWGNTVDNTRGCILVGDLRDVNTQEIFNTLHMFQEIYPAIEEAVSSEKGCWVTVEEAVNSNHDAVQEAVST